MDFLMLITYDQSSYSHIWWVNICHWGKVWNDESNKNKAKKTGGKAKKKAFYKYIRGFFLKKFTIILAVLFNMYHCISDSHKYRRLSPLFHWIYTKIIAVFLNTHQGFSNFPFEHILQNLAQRHRIQLCDLNLSIPKNLGLNHVTLFSLMNASYPRVEHLSSDWKI